FLPVRSLAEGLKAVENGQADYLVEIELSGRYALATAQTAPNDKTLRMLPLIGPRGDRVEASYGVAGLKGDPGGWVKRIDEGLAVVRASGEYGELYRRWLERYQPLRFTRDERQRLGERSNRSGVGRLRVGLPQGVCGLSEDQASGPQGLMPDLMRAIGERVGKPVEFTELSRSELGAALSRGEVDLIAGATFEELDILRMDYGRPVEISRGAIVHRKDRPSPLASPSDQSPRIAAVVSGAGATWASWAGVGSTIPYASAREAVKAVEEGVVDGAVVTELEAWSAIGGPTASSTLAVAPLPGEGYESPYVLAVRAGSKALLWDLEDGLGAVERSGLRREIESRWLGPTAEDQSFEMPVPRSVLMGIIAGLGGAAIAVGIWVTTLRRELHRRTARLRHEEARLKAITESVPALVYGYLERSTGVRELRYANRRLEEWAQVFPVLASGSPIDVVAAVHPADRKELERKLSEAQQALRPVQQEVRVQDVHGEYRWIQITLDPDPVGEGVLWHGIMQDATELRLATEALAQSEKNFRQIFEATQDAILVCGEGYGRILEANRAACLLYGYSREELLAMEVRELFDHPSDADPARDQSFPGPFRHRRKDGSTIDIECGRASVQYGGRPAMLSVNRDVTSRTRFEEQRRQLEGQILQAQKMESLGLLAGGIAHDFNNLLVGILGNASLARAQLLETESLNQTLDQIVLTARRASDLTQQLLAYAGRAKISVQAVDLSAVASEMVKLLGSRLSRGAKMVFSFSPRNVVTLADPVQVRQIVMNLLTNASDALKGGQGVITIRTGVAKFDRLYLSETFAPSDIPEGEYAFLEIADDGCGIAPDQLQRIFDPFFTTKFVGRGLGLSVALAIVQRHRGAIKVFSEQDRGTVFRLLLPLVSLGPGSAIELAPRDESAGGGAIILGGSESQVEPIARHLEAAGLVPWVARDQSEAAAARSGLGDIEWLIVLDAGNATFAEIRRLAPLAKVLVSELAPWRDRGEADGVLPTNPALLREALNAALSGGDSLISHDPGNAG
ncbi:MAG: PAS domain S-box protein, partial [Phycisphaerales bacterium]